MTIEKKALINNSYITRATQKPSQSVPGNRKSQLQQQRFLQTMHMINQINPGGQPQQTLQHSQSSMLQGKVSVLAQF
jgi:hypothetical protein